MTALKGRAVDAFLARPDKSVVLVYGPDSGLVTERSARVLASVDTGADPFAAVVLDGDTLADDPARLADEAWTVPLFGGRRTIRVTPTSRNIAAAVTPLLADPPADSLVVIEAGELKASSPLRKAVESSDGGAALPCYADDSAALDRLIDEETRAAGLEIAGEARALLHRLLGGDRLASRGELSKLCLYCHGAGTIQAEDVLAIAGDASGFALDVLADATGLGNAAEAERSYRKALAAGTAPTAVVGALSRHFLQLAEARHRIDRGETAESAMRALRPPVFYKREKAFRRQLGAWPDAALRRALGLVARSELETRKRPELAEAVVARCLLSLAGAARPGR